MLKAAITALSRVARQVGAATSRHGPVEPEPTWPGCDRSGGRCARGLRTRPRRSRSRGSDADPADPPAPIPSGRRTKAVRNPAACAPFKSKLWQATIRTSDGATASQRAAVVYASIARLVDADHLAGDRSHPRRCSFRRETSTTSAVGSIVKETAGNVFAQSVSAGGKSGQASSTCQVRQIACRCSGSSIAGRTGPAFRRACCDGRRPC